MQTKIKTIINDRFKDIQDFTKLEYFANDEVRLESLAIIEQEQINFVKKTLDNHIRVILVDYYKKGKITSKDLQTFFNYINFKNYKKKFNLQEITWLDCKALTESLSLIVGIKNIDFDSNLTFYINKGKDNEWKIQADNIEDAICKALSLLNTLKDTFILIDDAKITNFKFVNYNNIIITEKDEEDFWELYFTKGYCFLSSS